MKLRTPLWVVFWLLVAHFLILLSITAINVIFSERWPFSGLFTFTFALWLSGYLYVVMPLLGVALIILTLTAKVGLELRKFLIWTGSAPICILFFYLFLIFAFSNEYSPLASLFGLLAGTSMLLGAIAFLIGMIGSIVTALEQRKQLFLTQNKPNPLSLDGRKLG